MTPPASTPIDPALLEALGRFDTPTVCNALEIVAPQQVTGVEEIAAGRSRQQRGVLAGGKLVEVEYRHLQSATHEAVA